MATELTTTNNAFRYPTAANNGANFGLGISDMASDVDAMWSSGVLASRPGSGKTNAVYYATDTKLLHRWNGSAWTTLLEQGCGLDSLLPHVQTTSVTAAAGTRYYASAGITVTAPAPVAGAVFGVTAGFAASGSSPVTVAYGSGGGGWFGKGLGNAAANFPLGTPEASITGMCLDGTNWFIVAGEQDTGWVSLTIGGSVSAASGYTPAALLKGAGPVQVCGAVTAASIASNATLATVPSAMIPAQTVGGVLGYTGGPISCTIDTSGHIINLSGNVGTPVYRFDSISYRVA